MAALGGEAPWANDLRRAGIEVHFLGWLRPFDLLPFLALRRLIQATAPDVVHLWGPAALQTYSIVTPRSRARLIVSDVPIATKALSWHGRLLLRRAAVVTVWHPSESECLIRQGVAKEKLALIPLAVVPGCFAETEIATSPRVQPHVRVVLGIGPLQPQKNFRDAIWAFDILHYLYGDLCLVLIGDGPDRASLAEFSVSLGSTERVHLLGRVPDVTPRSRCAAVVWSTSRSGGTGALLEAAAASRPVVAYRVPGPADVVDDGQTGYLVDPGDKPVLARQNALFARRRQATPRVWCRGSPQGAQSYPATTGRSDR